MHDIVLGVCAIAALCMALLSPLAVPKHRSSIERVKTID